MQYKTEAEALLEQISRQPVEKRRMVRGFVLAMRYIVKVRRQSVKEILIKVMNEKVNTYKNREYNSADAALSTVAYTTELALEAGILSHDDYAEVMKEYARLYAEALKEEKERLREILKGCKEA